MYCNQCGTQLPDDSRFCNQCGAIVGATQLTTPVHKEALILSAKGKSGQVDLYLTKVTIRKKGYMAWNIGTKGDKDIYLNRITSVQFREPGLATVGYIRFSFEGGQESKGGLQAAIRDENAVTFTKGQAKKFREIRERVDMLMRHA